MSHSALVVQILISAPSDLPSAHRDIIHRAMRVWNQTHGKIYGIHFSPTDWNEGGSPAFGEYPQAVLNEQIVDDSDAAVVIFTDRLGSPTPEHESGTAEEINRLLDSGRQVAVVMNDSPRPVIRGKGTQAQRAALDAYVQSVQTKAFMGQYDDEKRLRELIDGLLSRMATQYRREADASLQPAKPAEPPEPRLAHTPASDTAIGVWPRLEVSESVDSDSKGRLRTKRSWYLVLESTAPFPITGVSYRYEDADGNPSMFDALSRPLDEQVDILPPGGIAKFQIMRTWGAPSSAMCVVEWHDQAGDRRETRATVRTP